MNLDRTQHLLSRLSIKHRELNVSVPFIFNPNQQKAHEIIKQHYARDGWIRAIVLKARRVGMSSYWDSVLWCHCLARAQAHAEIVAHLKDVSEKGLFRVPRDLASELNDKVRHPVCDIYARQIKFFHSDGDSLLDISTAGSVGGGRGLTLTALHLSEAALYPGQDSFLSILPAVSKAPDTIIVLESTAQGRVGIGKTFFEHWQSAADLKDSGKKGRHWNSYIRIFLSWLNDPACIGNAALAMDAPATDLERELMAKPNNATRAQIAWMRFVLEGECQGSEQKFAQEYPWTPEVAFISTGDPAFAPAEIKYAYSTRVEEPKRGSIVRDSNHIKLQDYREGQWRIYELPKPRCWYYIGVDCARGMETDVTTGTGRSTGDFNAIGIINGTTGDVAAKYSEWIDISLMAEEVDKAGRFYNRAMVIVELTGNLGLMVNKSLRDEYRYPNIYVWKGKDDRVPKPQAHSHSQGWETTGRTRDLLFANFRGKLRDGMKNIPGGLCPKDPELIEQMDVATMSTGMRWEVEKGHDDVLMSFMLAAVACSQYPPPNIMARTINVMETAEEKRQNALAALRPDPPLEKALAADLAYVFRRDKKTVRSAPSLRDV